MLTEMFTPVCDPTYSDTVAAAEAHHQSYALWQYKIFCEEDSKSLASDSQNAAFGACKTGGGCGYFAKDGTLETSALEKTARTFVSQVAGTLGSSSFNNVSKTFELHYSAVQGTTMIFASQNFTYKDGFTVSMSPSNATTLRLAPDTIEVQTMPQTVNGTHITVIISAIPAA